MQIHGQAISWTAHGMICDMESISNMSDIVFNKNMEMSNLFHLNNGWFRYVTVKPIDSRLQGHMYIPFP